MQSEQILEVRIGCPERQLAEEIAADLLLRRLAAAVHVRPPHETRFRWQGTVATGTEFIVAARTRRGLFDALAEAARALHPYKVPAITAIVLDPVDRAYREWLLNHTQPDRSGGGGR